MTQIHNSKDVHRLLVEDAPHSWLLGLVSFAIFEDRRFDWMQHFEEHNNRPPTNDEICSWYQQQSKRVLDDVVADAENALRVFSEEVVQIEIENIREDTENGVIVSEIRNTKNRSADFGLNVLGGLVGAFLFSGLLAIIVMIIFYDPSPIKMMQDYLRPQTKESTNGN